MKNFILILSCISFFCFAQQADAQFKNLTPTKEKTTGFKVPPSKEIAKRLLPPDKKIYDAMIMAGNCQPCSTKSTTTKGKNGSTNNSRGVTFCQQRNSAWGPVTTCYFDNRYCDTFTDWNITFCYPYPSGW